MDAVVGALPEVLAAEIPDDIAVVFETFHETRVEAGELARFGSYFIWTCFKEIHRFILVLILGGLSLAGRALFKDNIVFNMVSRKENPAGYFIKRHE